MIGITIASGMRDSLFSRRPIPYQFYADRAIENAKNNLGLEKVIVLSQEHLSMINVSDVEQFSFRKGSDPKIFFLKFFVFRLFPEIDRYVYFDIDWNCMTRPKNLDIFDSDKLVVVRDSPYFDFIINASKVIDIDPYNYFNAGFYVVNRKAHANLFEKCITHYKSAPKVFSEQCVMNYFAHHQNYPIQYANHMWNLLEYKGFITKLKCIGFHSPYTYDIFEGREFPPRTIDVDIEAMREFSGWFVIRGPNYYKRIYLLPDGYTDCDFEWIKDYDGNVYIYFAWDGNLAFTFNDSTFSSSEGFKLVRLS